MPYMCEHCPWRMDFGGSLWGCEWWDSVEFEFCPEVGRYSFQREWEEYMSEYGHTFYELSD